eukprot:EG_transcript_19925
MKVMTGGHAFLTEVSVGDEFAPPPHTGVKLRAGVGEKQLIFPEVRPRVFEPYTPGHQMFGGPSAYMGRKACPQFAKALNRERNLIRRDGMIIPPEIALAESETMSQGSVQRTMLEQEPPTVHMPPVSPSRSSVFSSLSASSFCSTCNSSCTGGSAVSCSTCAEAARQRRQRRAERRGPSSRCSATSSVPLSAYDNLTSVSQQRSHASHRSGKSGSSAILVAQLQEQLEQERKQREEADQKLQELQRKQEELVAKLAGSAAPQTPKQSA